jgi:WD40 repeat protein
MSDIRVHLLQPFKTASLEGRNMTLRALKVGVDALRDNAVRSRYPGIDKRYIELAVFPSGAAVPENVVQLLWAPSGLSGFDVQDYLDALAERSLIKKDVDGRISIHDLEADYLHNHAKNSAPLHRRMLVSYARHCSGSWDSGPDDGYFFQNLPYHIARGRGQAALAALLFDYRWLQSKLRATDSWQLLADFGLLDNDDAARTLQAALGLSASFLRSDVSQLGPHLLGRLANERAPRIRKLLDQVVRETEGTWLRPLSLCLSAPGGPLLHVLEAGDSWLRCLVVLADGELACGSNDSILYLWNLKTGERRDLYGHEHWVEALIVTPDGRLLSAGAEGTLLQWDLHSGTPQPLLTGRRGASLALLRNGLIAGAGYRDGLWVWDPSSPKPRLLNAHGDSCNLVAALPDGRMVSSGLDGVIRVWDAAARHGRRMMTNHKNLGALIPTPRGTLLYGGEDGAIVEMDPDALTERLFHQHGEYIQDLAISPGCAIASANYDDITIWPTGTTNSPTTIRQQGVKAMTWLSENLLAAGCHDGRVRVFDIGRQTRDAGPEEYGRVRALGVAESGWVIVERERGPILAWNYRRGVCRTALSEAKRGGVVLGSMAIGADGVILYESALNEFTAMALGSNTAVKYRFDDYDLAFDLVAGSRRRLVVADTDSGTVQVWEQPGVRPKTLKRTRRPLSSLAADAAGRVVVSSFDGSIRLWDVDLKHSKLLAPANDDNGVVSIAITRDGRHVAAGLTTGMIRLWDLGASGFRELPGHGDFVTGVAFTPGGMLVSGGFDSTLRLWNPAAEEQLALLTLEAQISKLLVDRAGMIIAGDSAGRVYAVQPAFSHASGRRRTKRSPPRKPKSGRS